MRRTGLWSRAWEWSLNEPAGVAPKPLRWTSLTRHIFRFSFCYYAVWITLNGNATIWVALPAVGHRLEAWLWRPLGALAQTVGIRVFGLQGPAAHWISRGVSDSALTLILTVLYVLLALLGAAVWSRLDRGRQEYQTLLAWMRFALRLTVGIGLMSYGLNKLLPLNTQPLDQAALHAQLGSLTPALALWTVSTASHGLQITTGVLELLAGLMLLYRRSALFGSLLVFFSLGVVMLVEIFFRMPVRVFTGHLLLADGSIILPDLAMVVRFFWSHDWSAPSGVWVDPQQRRGYLRGTALAELVLVLLVAAQFVATGVSHLHDEHLARAHPLPLLGGWQVHASSSGPPLSSKSHQPVTSVWFNRQLGRGVFTITLVTADGRMWAGSSLVNPAAGTMLLRTRYTAPRTYQMHWLNAGTLALVSLYTPGAAPYAGETLQRIPLPTNYRLLRNGPETADKHGYAR